MMIITIVAFIGSDWLSNSNIVARIFSNEKVLEYYTGSFEFALITISEILIVVVILLFKDRLIMNSKDNMYINLTWLFALFRISAANFFILHRLSKYFIYFYIISLLMSTKLFKDRRIKVIFIASIFLFYELWFYFYMRGYSTFHPYKIMDFFTVFPVN